MITEDEYQACIKGNMNVTAKRIMNLNCKHPTLLTGQSEKIFMGRATQIKIDKLLGLIE